MNLSLDDPEFFQKVNAHKPELFDQEEMAKNIAEEKRRNMTNLQQSIDDTLAIFANTLQVAEWSDIDGKLKASIIDDAIANAKTDIASLFESLINEVIIGENEPQEENGPSTQWLVRNNLREAQRAKAKQLLKEIGK